MDEPVYSPAERPVLRPLEGVPFEQEGDVYVMLRDPSGIAPTVSVPRPVALLLGLFDGSRTPAEIRDAWHGLAGEELPDEFVGKLATELDELLLVDGPRFRARREELEAEYRAQTVRPAAHCPGGYPEEPAACAELLDGLLEATRKPGVEADGRVRGLVAPHIDLQRGGGTYGAAYNLLRDSTADLFVVLGLAHNTICWPQPPPLASLTRLDFGTPLGTVRTDQSFIDDLLRHYAAAGGEPDELFVDELVHRLEHSVEFQALFLQHLHGHREFRFVPLLTGSLDRFYAQPGEAAGNDGLGPLLAALRAAIAGYDGEVCVVAGADLAHVGPQFGDGQPVDRARVDEVVEGDEAMLARLTRGSAEEFLAEVGADDNARHVCSVSNLFVLRSLLADADMELVRYEVAYDPQQTVTFAAAVLR